jgi:rubredoxin
MSDRDCPQCDVTMEKTTVTAEGVGDLYVETEREKGVLKRLGIGENTSPDAFLCPECGLIRLYADLST